MQSVGTPDLSDQVRTEGSACSPEHTLYKRPQKGAGHGDVTHVWYCHAINMTKYGINIIENLFTIKYRQNKKMKIKQTKKMGFDKSLKTPWE